MSIRTAPEAPALNARAGRPSARESRGLVVAAPRVDLLPPEIGERNRQRAARSGMRLIIFFAFILVLVGVAGAWYLSTVAQGALADEVAETDSLVSQQQQYADVRQAQQAIAVGEAARRVGASTEIDWQDYLQKLTASLPEGVSLTEVVIDSETSTVAYPQSTVTLEGKRIATLTFTATSVTLPKIPDWLNGLRDLPGFVDALPGSVAIASPGYTVSITMHINEDAFSHRFVEDDNASDADDSATGATGDGQ